MNYDGYLFTSARACWHCYMPSTYHHALQMLPGKTISAYGVTRVNLNVEIIWLFYLFIYRSFELEPTLQKAPCCLFIVVSVVRFPIYRSYYYHYYYFII